MRTLNVYSLLVFCVCFYSWNTCTEIDDDSIQCTFDSAAEAAVKTEKERKFDEWKRQRDEYLRYKKPDKEEVTVHSEEFGIFGVPLPESFSLPNRPPQPKPEPPRTLFSRTEDSDLSSSDRWPFGLFKVRDDQISRDYDQYLTHALDTIRYICDLDWPRLYSPRYLDVELVINGHRLHVFDLACIFATVFHEDYLKDPNFTSDKRSVKGKAELLEHWADDPDLWPRKACEYYTLILEILMDHDIFNVPFQETDDLKYADVFKVGLLIMALTNKTPYYTSYRDIFDEFVNDVSTLEVTIEYRGSKVNLLELSRYMLGEAADEVTLSMQYRLGKMKNGESIEPRMFDYSIPRRWSMFKDKQHYVQALKKISFSK